MLYMHACSTVGTSMYIIYCKVKRVEHIICIICISNVDFNIYMCDSEYIYICYSKSFCVLFELAFALIRY